MSRETPGQIVKYQGGELAYDPQNGLTPVRIEPQQVTSLQRAIAVIQGGPQKGQEATFYAAQNFAIALLGKEYAQHLASVSNTAITEWADECRELRQEVRTLREQKSQAIAPSSSPVHTSSKFTVIIQNDGPSAEKIVWGMVILFFGCIGVALFCTAIERLAIANRPVPTIYQGVGNVR